MKFTIPIYVEQTRTEGGAEFRVRPLFVRKPARRAELLSRAMQRVAQEIRSVLERAGRELRHDDLVRWSFSPNVETAIVDEKLLLRRRTIHCHLMVAAFDAFDRRVAFSPTVPGVWFEVARGESLRARAKETFTDYFRGEEKEDPNFIAPPTMDVLIHASVTEIDLDVAPNQKLELKNGRLFSALMGETTMDGRAELQRVGRRLDALFPDDLGRAISRETEVTELTRLLNSPDQRPVLLVGPRMAGKTALVHEYVYRRLEKLQNPYGNTQNVWLLSPQRLISGMMYVGQWENRLMAILDHAKRRRHVLYFDDLPGLFHAGLSASSKLSVAQALRPAMERRDIRFLAEINPEALRVLRERDRGFADLFHIIPVREPSEPDARRLLIAFMREMEGLHGCRFGIDVLPTAMELQQRYVRDLALPGKVAIFLKDLASKYKTSDISRREVLAEFHAKSGLSVEFLDRQTRLERADIVRGLERDVTGQQQAVDAMADIVSVAKAQLNDPGRPLGSILFLGPAGVGKTQAAKALAHYLFGNPERLLRFDMNEYVDPYSAARLVGAWNHPEGLLTAAVRRQPFAVILLDEIEKAHEDVFDLLLQVLGEGRLTDALGRTSDFGNTVIIMTSNLGVRAAGETFGFATGGADSGVAYRRAAEQFFRPEFFNRIDRVVPFARLTRKQTAQIAQRMIDEVLTREGLQQRRCMLSVAPGALARLVDQAYDPQLGARALRRAINRQFVQPVAAHLAATQPGAPTLLNVVATESGINVQVRPLAYAQCTTMNAESRRDKNALLDRADAALERIEKIMEDLKPRGRVVIGQISAAQTKYFMLREQFSKVERLFAKVQDGGAPRSTQHRAPRRPRQTSPRHSRIDARELLTTADLNQYLAEVAAAANAPSRRASEDAVGMERLLRELAYLHAMAGVETGARAILLLRALVGHPFASAPQVLHFFGQAGCQMCGYPDLETGESMIRRFGPFLNMYLKHPHGAVLFPQENGIHLYVQPAQELLPVEAVCLPVAPADDPQAAALRFIDAHRDAPPSDVPGIILRIYERNILDLRTSLVVPTSNNAGHYVDILQAQCPLPPEFGA